MKKFTDWFHENLTVGPYPWPDQVIEADIVINVSDEYHPHIHLKHNSESKLCHWFPMNECTENIGLNSIYGAMHVLWNAEQKGLHVYLHCHAGVNRSPTVADCYYFMRTGQYRLPKDRSGLSKSPFNQFYFSANRLQENIGMGRLPAQPQMEEFLRQCAESVKDWNHRSLDSCRLNMK